MTAAKGDGNGVRPRRSRQPSAEEKALWRLVNRETEPLPGRAAVVAPLPEMPVAPPPAPAPPPEPVAIRKPVPPRPLAVPPVEKGRGAPVAGLDRRTADRLRKGKLAIEARIDLHGMTQERAHAALDQFIASAADRGLRAVLVITGKGSGGSAEAPWPVQRPGVLRANVPRWLNEQPNAPRVLAVTEAQPQDGGAGALYVLLRRRRAPR